MDRRQLRSPKLPAGCLSAFLAKPIEQMFLFVVELQGNAVEKNYLGTSSTLDGYSLQSKSLEAMEAKLFFLLFIWRPGFIHASTLVELLKRPHFHVYFFQME